MDQVEQYRPPENPTKPTDRRTEEYRARFGSSCWELDALEPRVLHRLIDEEIRSLIDMSVWEETEAEETGRRHTLSQLHDRYYDIKEWLDENP